MVHIVMPGNVDDPGAPSGGNNYDREVCRGLAGAGWPVQEHIVPGSWPRPAPADRAALADTLAGVPDGAVAVLDGLVACPAPEVVTAESGRLRLVVLVHLQLADETGLPPEQQQELDAAERQTLRAADAVVATSAWSARRLVDHHGLAADRVHAAPPGVQVTPLAAGTDGVSRLLCVAAVTPRKGQAVLVEALAEVAAAPWTCVCVGDWTRAPAYVDMVRRLVRERGLADRVLLAGPRTGADLAAAYAAADLTVLASHSETYGMVITESLARGVPVLATRVGGAPEALGRAPDGNPPGMLVPPGDPAAFAGALRRWFDDGDLRDRLRSAARARRDALPDWADTVRAVAGVLARARDARRVP